MKDDNDFSPIELLVRKWVKIAIILMAIGLTGLLLYEITGIDLLDTMQR
jgi:hypothetical protein